MKGGRVARKLVGPMGAYFDGWTAPLRGGTEAPVCVKDQWSGRSGRGAKSLGFRRGEERALGYCFKEKQ